MTGRKMDGFSGGASRNSGAWKARDLLTFLALSLLLAMFLCLGAAGVSAASEEERRVYDEAGLFSAQEREELETAIGECRGEAGFDVAVVTTEDAGGKSGQLYADDFYEEYGLGEGQDKSGILFLIDMDNRELVFSTDGKAIRIFTDERIEAMLDDVYEGASDGDFYASAEVFLDDVKYYAGKGIEPNQYNYDTVTGKVSVYKSIRWYEALLAFGAAFAAAGIAAGNVVRQYNMESSQREIANQNMAYRADCNLRIGNQADTMVNSFVTTQRIVRSSGGGGGGTGRSRSGRSSTHHSSSGRSHGGGSRKF